ncbi:MAG: hypothetical protein A2V86_07000 [Deltaproteobacteria bacterium RBG_16_49_23]|nr:MAG: hypothetical protein A2V86_07000 [Deltaproteobacteria bacterium RBG_16_49_23]
MRKMFYAAVISILLSLCIFPHQVLKADQLDNWNVRNPLSQAHSYFAAAFGNSIFVAVGSTGAIFTSSDGISWTLSPSGSFVNLNGIAYGKGTFVAVGNSGTILTSTDGISWTSRVSGVPNNLQAATFGNGTFVAVSSGGRILTSPDGVNWTQRASPTLFALNGVAFGNGAFVVVGDVGIVLTSTDGVTWTSGFPNSNPLNGIVFGNSTFVAVGAIGTIGTSPNGVNWTFKTVGTLALQGVAFGNGPFVAVGNVGAILTSPDGGIWTSRASGTGFNLNAVAYGDGTFVAVGTSGTILQSDPKAFFDDVPLAHFAFAEVDAIAAARITKGCSANPILFCPDSTVTRSQMAFFLARALNGGDPTDTCTAPPFPDISTTDPFCPHVQFIKNKGVTQGKEDGTFGPSDTVTRLQMGIFLARGINADEGVSPVDPPGPCIVAPFSDIPASDPFCPHIAFIKNSGVTLGFGDGTYKPSLDMTRSEMALFLARAFLGF